MTPRISLVVPAYNEAECLPRLLGSVERARSFFPDGARAIETIVADNGSTDRTAEAAAAAGCRVVAVATRSIAAARNGGAAAARGEILCFTDADGRLHPHTFLAVERAMAGGRWVAGATGVVMERWPPGIAATYVLALPLLWLTGFDSGVVFCRRADFEAVGGYDESLRYAEDVALLRALRRHGKRNGRRLVRLRGVKTVASTRKFDQHGDWHYFGRMLPLAWRMLFRRSEMTEFAERYWYRPGR